MTVICYEKNDRYDELEKKKYSRTIILLLYKVKYSRNKNTRLKY